MAYTPKLTYKGRPLVRCGNEIYYGSLADPYVVFMQVLTTKEENGITVADKLHVILGSDPADSVSGRLRFIGNNGNFLPHQVIDQGGFSHVRPSGNGNNGSFCVHCILLFFLERISVPGHSRDRSSNGFLPLAHSAFFLTLIQMIISQQM